MYRRLAMLIVGGLVCVVCLPTPGQEGIISQLYGNGVHAYFAGKYEEAYEFFNSAIQAGTKDPRVYYFRGLTYLKLGRPEEAEQDFIKGAELETADVNQLYPVGRALQRVQGNHRLKLEQYREEARLASWKRQLAAEKARYQGLRQRVEEGLQQQAQGAKLPPSPPPVEAPTVPPEKAPPPPFAEQPVEKPSGVAEEKPISPFEMPGEKPGEKPSLPSPFGEQPAEKPAMPAEQPTEKPAAQPETPEEKPTMTPETPEATPAEKPASPFEMPGEKPGEKPSLPSPFDEEPPAKSPPEKPTVQVPSPFEETPPNMPPEKPAGEPEQPAEKPETPSQDKPPAAKRSLLRGLLGATQRTLEDLAKPAGQTLEKLLPTPGAGVSPFPGAAKPKLDLPVPPPPLPKLPGLPGIEPALPKPESDNPFEEQPAPKPADKTLPANPF
ncbi:MAG: hypothetical protein NZ602_03115 [Thermoguttaceae bacterium]|nr:hypothetical protein [Thermoguttaceae bacterium]MDW8036415.1 hypothetical protein [Thermoguttaceae bacterium]